MPFFQIGQKLVFYAHVPKCGGSSIASYIRNRFGALAFHNNAFSGQPELQRWTKSSPQHVDAVALGELIPMSFFSAIFAIVRHPVGRAVSSYHFQLEVEKSIPGNQSFSDWLAGLGEAHARNPFAYDNHTRPMTDIVPNGAKVFHIEHDLDALIPWFDTLAGNTDGQRALVHQNSRGAYTKGGQTQVAPTDADLDIIKQLYAADFKRFGYSLDKKMPTHPAPELSPDFLIERDKARTTAARPLTRLKRKAIRRLRRT